MVGKGHSNYLETVRLYEIAKSGMPPLPGPTDVFCSLKSLPVVMSQMPASAPLFVVGRVRAAGKEIETAEWSRRAVLLDGPDFAFHSREEDVAGVIRCAADQGVQSLVFHNNRGRIESALKRLGVDRQAYRPLSGCVVDLRE